MEDADIKGALMGTVAMLRDLTETLTNARQMLYGASIGLTLAREELADYETGLRAGIILDGLEGRNEAERQARLTVALTHDRDLSRKRDQVRAGEHAVAEAQALYDRAYRTQQSERAILAALTAMVSSEAA